MRGKEELKTPAKNNGLEIPEQIPAAVPAIEEIMSELGFRYIDLDKEVRDLKFCLPLRCFVPENQRELSDEYIDGLFQSMLDLPNYGNAMDDTIRYLRDNALIRSRVILFVGTPPQLRFLHKLRALPEQLPIIRKDCAPRFHRLTMRHEKSCSINVFILNYNELQLY